MESRHTVYFNMCNHYRKLFNAKARVDTSAPKTLKPNTKPLKVSQNFHTNTEKSDQKLTSVKRNNLETTMLCHQNKVNQGPENNRQKFVVRRVNKNEQITGIRIKSQINPTVSRNNYSTYSSTRTKSQTMKSAENKVTIGKMKVMDKDINNLKLGSLSIADGSIYSGESSDSAYNEGEGILSDDSRGSTPKQLIAFCKPSDRPITKSFSYQKQNPIVEVNRSDEMLYIHFLKNVTDDILKKNVFTNKALKNIFEYHIQQNSNNLDKRKMIEEINKLQQDLGVPKDDRSNGLGFGMGNISYHSDTCNDYENEALNPNNNKKNDVIDDGSENSSIYNDKSIRNKDDSIDSNTYNDKNDDNDTTDDSFNDYENEHFYDNNDNIDDDVDNTAENKCNEKRTNQLKSCNTDKDSDDSGSDIESIESYSGNSDNDVYTNGGKVMENDSSECSQNDTNISSDNNHNISTIEEENTVNYLDSENDTDCESEINEEIN